MTEYQRLVLRALHFLILASFKAAGPCRPLLNDIDAAIKPVAEETRFSVLWMRNE